MKWVKQVTEKDKHYTIIFFNFFTSSSEVLYSSSSFCIASATVGNGLRKKKKGYHWYYSLLAPSKFEAKGYHYLDEMADYSKVKMRVKNIFKKLIKLTWFYVGSKIYLLAQDRIFLFAFWLVNGLFHCLFVDCFHEL